MGPSGLCRKWAHSAFPVVRALPIGRFELPARRPQGPGFRSCAGGAFCRSHAVGSGCRRRQGRAPDGDATRLWGPKRPTFAGIFISRTRAAQHLCRSSRTRRAVILPLVREADIVIENYRPDVKGRHGFDYETLAAENPHLIMLSISGFGHNGPESRRPAYAAVIHAELGLISRQARRGEIPRRDLLLSVADTNAGLHGLVGVLSAVIMRSARVAGSTSTWR